MSSTSNLDGAAGDLAKKSKPTAGIIIIGDEVLKGQVQDINTAYFCEKLTKLGVKVVKVTAIGDDLDSIAEEVKRFSKEFTYVFTSGGVGPTHDDLTFESVARAFNVPLKLNPVIEQFCKDWFKTDELSLPILKMATIPETAKLNFGQDPVSGKKNKFPLVSVENVYMFPGVPPLLRRAMDILAPTLFHHPEFCASTSEMFVDLTEVNFAAVLNKAVEAFPKVSFGSYPVLNHSYYKTQVTAEAEDKSEVDAALEFMRTNLPTDKVVTLDRFPSKDRWDKLQRLLTNPGKRHLKEPIQQALEVIEKCYNQYGPESVCLFFNGGKDCTAVLHLVSCYLSQKYPDARITAVHVAEDDRAVFPQVHEFIEETEARYDLNLLTYHGTIKEALKRLLEEHPQFKAAFLGMRMGDPHAVSTDEHFAMTDPDWPQIMRVYPILHMSYGVLWDFIRSLYLPYCSLYDRGFTSLGKTETTFPNPALQTYGPDGKVTYKPAYMLEDPTKERDGRIKSPQKKPETNGNC